MRAARKPFSSLAMQVRSLPAPIIADAIGNTVKIKGKREY